MNFKKKSIISVFTLFFFIFNSFPFISIGYAENIFSLPKPGAIVSTTNPFRPILFKGVSVDPQNALKFEILIDQGDSQLNDSTLQKQATNLFKYFLAALTTTEEDIWVNLSPFERNRIINKSFGNTLMGRDMLAQDYMLKQLTSSIMFSDEDLSQNFWDTIYEKMYELYGHVDLDVSTFNKVWIVPDKAVVYEDGLKAVVLKSHLKVLLEEDYVALSRNNEKPELKLEDEIKFDDNLIVHEDDNRMHQEAAKILKEIIIPAIEKEVNEGSTFSKLRQIYHALILASWYKQRLKDSLLAKIYADRNKTIGIDTLDKKVVQKIYNQYVDGFNKGVYNFIREDYDPVNQEIIPRKYVSGGVGLFNPTKETIKNGVKKFGAYLSGILIVLTASTLATSTDVQAEALNKFSNSQLYKAELALTEVGPNYGETNNQDATDNLDEPINLWVKSHFGNENFILLENTNDQRIGKLAEHTQRSLIQVEESKENNEILLSDTQVFDLTLKYRDLNFSLSYYRNLAENRLFNNAMHSSEIGTSYTSSINSQFPLWLQLAANRNNQLFELESDPNILMSSSEGLSSMQIRGSVNRSEAMQEANSIYLSSIYALESPNFSPYISDTGIPVLRGGETDVDRYLKHIQTINDTSSFTWKNLNKNAVANAYADERLNQKTKSIIDNIQKERYSRVIGHYSPIVSRESSPMGMLLTTGARFRDKNDYYSATVGLGYDNVYKFNLSADMINWKEFQFSTEGSAWIRDGEPGYQLGINVRSNILRNSSFFLGTVYKSDEVYSDKAKSEGGFYIYGGIEMTFGLRKNNTIRTKISLPGPLNNLINKKRTVLSRNSDDGAMTTQVNTNTNSDSNFTKGGIDFNPELLDLQIRRDKNWIPLPLNQQPLENIQVEGLIPVIINVVPINSIPEFIGVSTKKKNSAWES